MSFVLANQDTRNPIKIQALQKRIGWICQLGRILAAGYAVWTLWLVIRFWSDGAMVARRFSQLSGEAITDVSFATQAAGFVLYMLDWGVVAFTCFSAWQLFTGYRQGRIFTPEAAGILRTVTLAGIAAIAVDIVLRPVLVLMIAGTVPSYTAASYYYFSPHDLALLIFFISLFAIAHIFKVAAELAEENAEIL